MSPLVGDPAGIQALNLDPSCPTVPEDILRLFYTLLFCHVRVCSYWRLKISICGAGPTVQCLDLKEKLYLYSGWKLSIILFVSLQVFLKNLMAEPRQFAICNLKQKSSFTLVIKLLGISFSIS